MKDIARVLDEKATSLAKRFLETEAEILAVLIEMRRHHAFAVLNYSGIFDYCERKLRLSKAQAYYFKSVAEKAEEVPEIKASILAGELTLSQARRIVPVLTKDNHEEWIEKAKTLSQVELEREVTAVNPKAHTRERIRPVAKDTAELKVPVTTETEEDLAFLREVLSQKRKGPASLKDLIAWMAKECRERHDPVRKAERSKAISSGNPKKGRQPLRANVKHPVMLRDKMRCTYVSPDGRRCEQRRWLALHHVVEVSKGGLNTVDNLRTLCSAHHKLVHRE